PPNVVVYSNVLSGLSADLMAVWANNGYEQNLVIKQRPPTPESFGLSSAATRLQLWTVMDSCPAPLRQRTFTLKSGLVDHILEFSDCWFPVGSAFNFNRMTLPAPGQPVQIKLLDPMDPGAIPIAKSLVDIGGTTTLIEEIEYSDVQNLLTTLPE